MLQWKLACIKKKLKLCSQSIPLIYFGVYKQVRFLTRHTSNDISLVGHANNFLKLLSLIMLPLADIWGKKSHASRKRIPPHVKSSRTVDTKKNTVRRIYFHRGLQTPSQLDYIDDVLKHSVIMFDTRNTKEREDKHSHSS